jgi:hypothetical protein
LNGAHFYERLIGDSDDAVEVRGGTGGIVSNLIVSNQYGSLSSLQIAGFAAVGMTELWVWLAF